MRQADRFRPEPSDRTLMVCALAKSASSSTGVLVTSFLCSLSGPVAMMAAAADTSEAGAPSAGELPGGCGPCPVPLVVGAGRDCPEGADPGPSAHNTTCLSRSIGAASRGCASCYNISECQTLKPLHVALARARASAYSAACVTRCKHEGSIVPHLAWACRQPQLANAGRRCRSWPACRRRWPQAASPARCQLCQRGKSLTLRADSAQQSALLCEQRNQWSSTHL